MNFQKNLTFLGMQENKFQDGSSYFKLSFFDPDGNVSVSLNVGGNNADLLASLRSLKFGSSVLCDLCLIEKDKLFKLSLRAIATK